MKIVNHTKMKNWKEVMKTLNQITKNLTPFNKYEWVSSYLKCFPPSEEVTLIEMKEEEKPIAGGIIVIGGEKITLVGDKSITDYQDFMIKKGEEEKLLYLIHYLLNHYSLPLEIHSLPQFSPLLSFLPNSSFNYTLQKNDVSPFILLPSSLEKYLFTLSSKCRHELRRKIRKTEEINLQFKVYYDSSKVFNFLKLFTLSEEKKKFLTPKKEEFFIQLAWEFGKSRELVFFFLQLDTKYIASYFCFELNDTLYVYNSGYDPNYKHLSPGILTLYSIIHWAITKRLTKINLLRGDERYKYEFGAKDIEIYELCIK